LPPTATPTLPGAAPTATATPFRTATPFNAATATPIKTATPFPTATPAGASRPVLPLLPGANLMTWPGGDASPAVALAGQPWVKAVYGYDPVTKIWSRYIPSLPAFVNNLVVLKQGRAYWFISDSSGQIPYVP